MENKILSFKENTDSFDAHRKVFDKNFAYLESLYNGEHQKKIEADVGYELTAQEQGAQVGAMRVPAAKACWNAIMMMREKARSDDEKAAITEFEKTLKEFLERPDINMRSRYLFDPFNPI